MKLKPSKPRRGDIRRAIQDHHRDAVEREKARGVDFDHCYVKDCNGKVETVHSCTTCEKVAAEKGVGVVFRRKCCLKHRGSGLDEMKKHAVTKHPVNLLRVMAAGLAGEEI